MRMLEEKHEEVFARGFMLSSALLLYFQGDSTIRCRCYERSASARRKRAEQWMQTFTQLRVFFRVWMRGVSVDFTSAWRV